MKEYCRTIIVVMIVFACFFFFMRWYDLPEFRSSSDVWVGSALALATRPAFLRFEG